MTRSVGTWERLLISDSAIPSPRYSRLGSAPGFTKGKTASESSGFPRRASHKAPPALTVATAAATSARRRAGRLRSAAAAPESVSRFSFRKSTSISRADW